MTRRPPLHVPPMTQEAFPPLPVCWPALDQTGTDEALEHLEPWVDWLLERYGLDHRTVPECWPLHGALIEEISALHTAWTAAYAQTAQPTAPLDWHANFAAARQRLTDWVARTGCRPGTHRLAEP